MIGRTRALCDAVAVLVVGAGLACSTGARHEVTPTGSAPSVSTADVTLRVLTETPGRFELWPTFFPGGGEVLSVRTDDMRRFELVAVDLDGGAERVVPVHGAFQPTRPSWHRASGRVALTGLLEGGTTGTWILEAESGALAEVRGDGLGPATHYPSWGPAGRELVVTDFDERQRGTVKRVRLSDASIESLTDPELVLAGRAYRSPLRDAVVFAGQEPTDRPYDQTANDLFLRDPTGRVRRLTERGGRAPCYSPDGEWIAYEEPVGDDPLDYRIMLVPADGGPATPLTPPGVGATHPSWSPDGRRIVCSVWIPQARGGGAGLLLIEGFRLERGRP